jgi:hypothetical protein
MACSAEARAGIEKVKAPSAEDGAGCIRSQSRKIDERTDTDGQLGADGQQMNRTSVNETSRRSILWPPPIAEAASRAYSKLG